MKKIIIFIIASFIIGVFCFFFIQRTKWSNYYKKTLYRAPATIIVEGAHFFDNPGSAIDLGCGVGNDTAYLLNNGWQVWAVDADARAFTWLLSRNDLPRDASLHTVTARFEAIDWATLPDVDFVSASLSLPFCAPGKFHTIWHQLITKIKPGGRFAGHFFGVDYKGFSDNEKKGMTFLTKEQITNLFRDFTIEIMREQKDENESKSATGSTVRTHIFEVVARKKMYN